MTVLDQNSCVFTTLQESLRIQKDSILGIMDKYWSTTFNFVPPCRNKLLRSKTAHSWCGTYIYMYGGTYVIIVAHAMLT